MKGLGRAAFVATLLFIAGVLNIIYGIAGIGNAHFFDGTQYVFSSVHTWGWITVIVGIIQLAAGASLMAGGVFGRVIGIFAASLGALESLLSIGGRHPWWSLAIFAMCIWILNGLISYGPTSEEAYDPNAVAATDRPGFDAGSRATMHR